MDETSDSSPLRIVFAGTPDFSVPALCALEESDHEVVGVITNPDRPRGRGRDPLAPPVKEAAEDFDIPVFQPETMKSEEAARKLADWEPDVMVVVAYGQILPARILETPTHGCINIHASLLPKYRGAAPINWAIVEGEEETGVTIMQMDKGLDTGPMLLQEAIPIGPLETGQELHDRLADLGGDMIVEALDKLSAGELEATPQDDEGSSYASKLSKSDGEIDWTKSAERIANEIRGFNPWPGSFSHHHRDGESERVKFHLAKSLENRGEYSAEAGEVVESDCKQGRLLICCGEGLLECLELQAPGGRRMTVGDFLNGYDIDVGDHFG